MTKTGMAILVGCANYEGGLLALPQAQANIVRLQHFLRDTSGFYDVEIKRDNIVPVSDPSKNADILAALDKARPDLDFLLFYYCGHGFAEAGDLYLGLTTTRKHEVKATAFPVEVLHSRLATTLARVLRKLVIYDCCYSGVGIGAEQRAPDIMQDMGSPNSTPTGMFSENAVKSWQFGGAAFWAASAPHEAALAHKTAPFSLFTDELMTVFEEGVDDGNRVLT